MTGETKHPYIRNHTEMYGWQIQRLLDEGYRISDTAHILTLATGAWVSDSLVSEYIKKHGLSGFAKHHRVAKVDPKIRALLLKREGR